MHQFDGEAGVSPHFEKISFYYHQAIASIICVCEVFNLVGHRFIILLSTDVRSDNFSLLSPQQKLCPRYEYTICGYVAQ
jgi:hypothetical protein